MGLSKASIVVLKTTVGDNLVISAGPTNDEVRNFVLGHVAKFKAGEPGGPAGHAAYQITSARRYKTEEGWIFGTDEGTPVKIEDLL